MSRRQKPKRRAKSSLFLASIVLFAVSDLTLAAQEGIDKDTRPQTEISQETKAEDQEPVSEQKKEEGYVYDPTGKTDPFKSFIAVQEETQDKTKRKPTTYLETVDLSQLELTAILTSREGNLAMVRDSKGEGYVIREGTYIGTRGGVVYKITEEEVIIREEYKDFRGRDTYREISKKLPSLS